MTHSFPTRCSSVLHLCPYRGGGRHVERDPRAAGSIAGRTGRVRRRTAVARSARGAAATAATSECRGGERQACGNPGQGRGASGRDAARPHRVERKRVGSGKYVSGRVDLGGRRLRHKNTTTSTTSNH